MGNATSRQKIKQSFYVPAVSWFRRTYVGLKVQTLVQSIKKAVGLDPKLLAITPHETSRIEQHAESTDAPLQSETPQTQVQPAVDESASNSSDRLPEHLNPSASRAVDVRDELEDDILVENIKKALKDAAPRPSAKSALNKQHQSEGNIVISPEAISKPAFGPIETYKARVDALDAIYGRVIPESKRPTKPESERLEIIDGYDNQVTDYVFSSLMVALPQRQHTKPGADITFEPAVSQRSEKETAVNKLSPDTIAPSNTTSGPNAQLVRIVAHASDDPPLEPNVDDALVNYRTWNREVYSKLCLDPSSIRLVAILPGSLEDHVSVRLDVHLLSEVAMKYEALSYVWGNPEPAKKILVNQVEQFINPSLYDALVSFRLHDSVRCIWIDAICLNQMSLAEKSKEVPKMGQIYSLAKKVNVFLGAPSTSDPSSIGSLLTFLNRDDVECAAEQYAREGFKGLHSVCEKLETSVSDVCKGFVEACLQPWWGRIWTLQEFYLAKEEPLWYWGREYASNSSLKRDFNLLMSLSWDLFTSEDTNKGFGFALTNKMTKPISSFKIDLERILTLISRRHTTNGFDSPQRLYRELNARATDPHDFVYGLRAIFNPTFGRVFVPDYQMSVELLFATLAVFLIQFECWADVLWCYPGRFAPEEDIFPSWLPNFTRHVMPHELDVQPLDLAAEEVPEPKMVVLNHHLYAEGYKLDQVYAHRHVDNSDGEKIFQELWQFDRCMNHNHECHKYFIKGASPEDVWFKVILQMYGDLCAGRTYFNSSYRGALLQSTINPSDCDKLPQQVAECHPCWDLLQWFGLRISTPGLPEALGYDINDAGPGYLDNIFSDRMGPVFRKAFADNLIGACVFDWGHFSVWLKRFPRGLAWSKDNAQFWAQIQDSLPNDTDKRAKAIFEAYYGYQSEIQAEVMQSSWCYSFYYAYLAFVILLDCDSHDDLARIIAKLQMAAEKLRGIHLTPRTRIQELASTVPSIATRMGYSNTVIDLFRGRCLFWTTGGFRGISCPGVEMCCDNTSIVAIVDGLSFPLVVRDYNEETGEGWLGGCALIRGVDMLGRDTEKASLPPDYQRGERRRFKFR